MKLLRFGQPGQEKPGLQLNDDRRIDASGFGQDWDENFFADPENLDRLREWADANAGTAPVIEPGTRLGPSLCRPSKIVCIGLNFKDHAEETGAHGLPPSRSFFSKPPAPLVGPDDDLVIPRGQRKNRLGSRTRRRHRQKGQLRRRGRRRIPYRRLRPATTTTANAPSSWNASASG